MARSSPDPDHTADDTLPPDPAPVPQPVPDIPPDPERIPPLSLLVLGDIVTLFELLSDSPTGHSLATRAVALRRDYDLLVFHSKPPEKK